MMSHGCILCAMCRTTEIRAGYEHDQSGRLPLDQALATITYDFANCGRSHTYSTYSKET